MTLPVLIAAPTAPVLSVAECKTLLGIDTASDDAVLELLIGAITENIDPAYGGWLGRALRPQTWELRLSSFPSCEIELPYPVLSSVTSVKYDTAAGVETTLTEGTDYRVFGAAGHNKARLEPIYNGSWPTARTDDESVRIRYVCGYDGAAMPKAIKSAIALGVRQVRSEMERSLYLSSEDVPGVRSRAWIVTENAQKVMKAAVENLLSTYRVWG